MFVQIDELREKYLKNFVSEEYFSLYQFIKCIEDNENLILEFTGAGCHKYAVKRALELTNDNTLIITCKTKNFTTIKKRIKNKRFLFGNPFSLDINNHIEYIQKDLEDDSNKSFWCFKKSKLLNIFMDNEKEIETNIKLIIDLIYKSK